MPKRSATTPEISPRKLTRRTSKSPAKAEEPEPQVQEAEGDLTNISDEEMEVEASSGKAAAATATTAPLLSSQDLREFRNKFFERFLEDLKLNDISKLNVGMYRSLCKDIPEEDPGEQKSIVDQQFKDFVIEKLSSMSMVEKEMFLEISIHLAREQVSSASLTVNLISDLLELSPLEDCEEIFSFVEQRLEVWKEPIFVNSGKNAVLRMCNDLLRRLSRAQNTIFCGRILLFLANYFPFSERSGLNIMSEFNSDNVTTYKKGDGTDDPDDQMEIVEEKEEKLFEGMDIGIPGLDQILSITQEEKKKKVKVDYNLYVKFWSLQDFFRNPTQCYNKVSWKSFTLYIQDVLGAFTSFKIDASQNPRSKKDGPGLDSSRNNLNKSLSSINVVPKLGDDLYFPKYLTNRRLLELQMGDPSFRRHFLVQLLVILQYLTTNVKFKSEAQVLNDEQMDFVKKTSEKIFTLLKEIKPGGRDFVKSVQHILKREDLWNKWKNDGCQPFKKPASSAEAADGDKNKGESAESEEATETPAVPAAAPKRRLGEIIEEAEKNNRFLLGNSELTRLWNICGNNLEACRAESRDFIPSIENYFSEAFKELDPEPTPAHIVADPSKRKVVQKKNLSNPNFGWRALRLLARNSPYFFQFAPSPPIQPLQNYLEYILKKIATDMEIPTPQMEPEVEKSGNDSASAGEPTAAPSTPGVNDGEQVMEGDADDNDELLKSGMNPENEEDEEGEVDESVRNLTEEELQAVGKLLGDSWKKVAAKLQFTKDEIEFFESEKGKNAGTHMLRIWTEQEKEDATVADLLYQLEGLKLRELVNDVFPVPV